MELKYLTRTEIDIDKWNECIFNSKNSMIYANSWYLDCVAKNWSGITNADYSCVMPITWNKKLAIKYVYRPFLIQQLGVFHLKEIKPEITEFINYLTKKFPLINYNFNYLNLFEYNEIKKNTNFVLDLEYEYNEINSNYSKNTKTYLKKAQTINLVLEKNLDIELFIKLKKENLPNKLDDKNFNTLRNLHKLLKNNTVVYGVYLNEILVSAAFFAFYNSTFYYLSSASSELGKKHFASFYLIDNFIKNYCEKSFKLDFEGSNLPGVARFFSGWGSTAINYNSLFINNLPAIIKFFYK